ncbi:hypothetical protein ACQV5M_20350 [Leptospira sp. SA-E8]|uniref:hypothetical protein n=1 Tax=Leptospira sp. SA-E8 TaxID=3422259 RepID=UPI003EB9B189
MNPSDFLWHSLNFAAPALALALLVPVLGWVFLGRRRVAMLPWWGQMLAQLAAGLAVLGSCFWLLGHDGQMMAYAGLVLVTGSLQWLLLRGWQG